MKKFIFLMAVVAVSLLMLGCATASHIGGAYPQMNGHGLFTTTGSAVEAIGGTEIASYSVILGLVTSGYPEYVAAVRAAEAEGKTISTINSWMIFLTKTTAYAQ